MNKQTLGTTISSLRKEKEMTQLELAEMMNVTDKAVSKWERDLSCPDVNTLPRLAEIFDISVDELMQVKERSGGSDKEKIGKIVNLIFKAVALAMGVAVTVMSILGEIESNSAFTMLGIGLACVGISLLQNSDDDN